MNFFSKIRENMSKMKILKDDLDKMFDNEAQSVIESRFKVILSLAKMLDQRDIAFTDAESLEPLINAKSLDIEFDKRHLGVDLHAIVANLVTTKKSKECSYACRQPIFAFWNKESLFCGLDIVKNKLLRRIEDTKHITVGETWDEIALNLVLMGRLAS